MNFHHETISLPQTVCLCVSTQTLLVRHEDGRRWRDKKARELVLGKPAGMFVSSGGLKVDEAPKNVGHDILYEISKLNMQRILKYNRDAGARFGLLFLGCDEHESRMPQIIPAPPQNVEALTSARIRLTITLWALFATQIRFISSACWGRGLFMAAVFLAYHGSYDL